MAETLLDQPIHPEDPDDDWLTPTNQGKSVRVGLVTGALVVLLVLAGGFWAGVVAEKHHGTGSTTLSSALATRIAAARGAGGTGGTGFSFAGGGAGAGGRLTSGTVIDVQGNVVDISDSAGKIVKVQVGPATAVTRTAKSSPAGLQIGDTVVVSGSAGAGGTVSATAVRATAQGVTAGSGFAGSRGGTGTAAGAGG